MSKINQNLILPSEEKGQDLLKGGQTHSENMNSYLETDPEWDEWAERIAGEDRAYQAAEDEAF